MSNISGKLNLRQLPSQLIEKGGKDYLIIPVKEANLYKGEKGIYLDFQGWAFENKQENSKDTHIVKQSLPKKVYEAMNEEQRRAMPIIGTLIDWGGSSRGESDAVESEGTLEMDDLPF